MIEENTLLLYWSGELSRKESEEVEARLAHDSEAVAYLEELDALKGGVGKLAIPEIPPFFIEECLRGSADPVENFPPVSRSRFHWIRLADVAAVLILSFSLFFVANRKGSTVSNEPEGKSGITGTRKRADESAPLLSKRLFSSNERHFSSLRSARERRTSLERKTNT